MLCESKAQIHATFPCNTKALTKAVCVQVEPKSASENTFSDRQLKFGEQHRTFCMLYIHTYIHMYVHRVARGGTERVRVYMHTHTHIYIHIHMYAQRRVQTRLKECVVCMYILLYVCICVRGPTCFAHACWLNLLYIGSQTAL
jgi:hypothetical protein